MLGSAVVSELNERFTNAKESNDLSEVGVFMRAWDGISQYGQPWKPCTLTQHCARYSDRFATSIVYPTHPQTYAAGGLVLRPDQIELNCAYASDGGSQGVVCDPPGKRDDCTPGCKRWCDPSRGSRNWGCSWPPEHLRDMISQQKILEPNGGYNEVIVGAEAWVRNLPHTINAVFVHKGAPANDVANSKRVHANFLEEYGITSEETPLVEYDYETGHFELYRDDVDAGE